MSDAKIRFELVKPVAGPDDNPVEQQDRTYVFGPGKVQMVSNGVVVDEWYCTGLTITEEGAEGGPR